MGEKGSGLHGKQGRHSIPAEMKKQKVGIRLYPEMIRKLKAHRLSIAQIIDEALNSWFERRND